MSKFTICVDMYTKKLFGKGVGDKKKIEFSCCKDIY